MISRGQMMWCLFRKLLINNNDNNGNNTRERKKMFHSSTTNQNQWNVHKKTKFVATTFARFVCIVCECVPVCERPFSWSNKHSLKWVNRANEIKQSKPSLSKSQQKKTGTKTLRPNFFIFDYLLHFVWLLHRFGCCIFWQGHQKPEQEKHNNGNKKMHRMENTNRLRVFIKAALLQARQLCAKANAKNKVIHEME